MQQNSLIIYDLQKKSIVSVQKSIGLNFIPIRYIFLKYVRMNAIYTHVFLYMMVCLSHPRGEL